MLHVYVVQVIITFETIICNCISESYDDMTSNIDSQLAFALKNDWLYSSNWMYYN